MASLNPFDLLGDDDAEDPLQLIAAQQTKKAAAPAPAQTPAKLPSKALPPAQAVRESRAGRGRGRGGHENGRGYGRVRGSGGFNRERTTAEKAFGNGDLSGGQASGEEADGGRRNERRGGYGGPRGQFRGGSRGGFNNGEGDDGERPRQIYERRSGTGHWETEEVVNEGEKVSIAEKPSGEEDVTNGVSGNPAIEGEDKESDNKEMTLEEYEKVLEEKRKALQSLKTEERKVDVKVFASMQQLANKKSSDDVFIKLSSEKEKKKELADKEERAKKAVSITEFLRPAEGEQRHFGGRGRGRGHGTRGYEGRSSFSRVEAPSIEDPGQFPLLSVK